MYYYKQMFDIANLVALSTICDKLIALKMSTLSLTHESYVKHFFVQGISITSSLSKIRIGATLPKTEYKWLCKLKKK